MTFDRAAHLSVKQATSFAELKRQMGQVGAVNGPRTGENKRSTISNEAYLARRFILSLAASGDLGFPLSVDHRDGPDFIVSHGTSSFSLEVTEACPEREGHAMANQGDEVVAVGDYSRSGNRQALADLQDQIQDAIDRKRRKPYAAELGSALLVYPNSDAALWIALFRRRNPLPFLAKLRIQPYQSLYVLWSSDRIYARKSVGDSVAIRSIVLVDETE